MTEQEAISVVLGVIAPYLISLAKRRGNSPRIVFIYAVATCLWMGAMVTIIDGKFDVHNLTSTSMTVFTVSQVLYRALGRSAGLGWLEDIGSPKTPDATSSVVSTSTSEIDIPR